MSGRIRCMRARTLVLAAALLLPSTACLRQDTNSGVILRPTPRPTATPIAPGIYAVGATVRRPTGNTVAVLQFAGPFPGDSASLAVVAAEIEGCASSGNSRSVKIATQDFELEMSDKTRRPVASGDEKSPDYTGRALRPGRCERGWLHFEHRSDEKPAFVVYQARPPIRWKVG